MNTSIKKPSPFVKLETGLHQLYEHFKNQGYDDEEVAKMVLHVACQRVFDTCPTDENPVQTIYNVHLVVGQITGYYEKTDFSLTPSYNIDEDTIH